MNNDCKFQTPNLKSQRIARNKGTRETALPRNRSGPILRSRVAPSFCFLGH